MIDNTGQVSAEFLFVFGVLILIVMLSIVFVSDQQELNIAMSAARSGAIEGIGTSSVAIYPEKTFREYSYGKGSLLMPYDVRIVLNGHQHKKPHCALLMPYDVRIINVSYRDLGMM